MDFRARRARLMERMGDGAALVLPAAPERRRSADTLHPYRPDSDLLYLTGFEEPETVLVLVPGRDEGEFVLFVRPRDREREIWDGFRAGPEGAVERFGADDAYSIEELDETLPALLSGRDRVYYALGEQRSFDARVLRWIKSLGASRKKPDRSPRAIYDPRRVIHDMRRVKDADEIAAIERSARVSAEAHLAAMKATYPGMMEYELQAEIEHVFGRAGASAPAYPSIVAGGSRACVLHYIDNDRKLLEGELVLVDAGAEIGWYAGDITRTWPVGPRFSGPQRDLYAAVLDAQEHAVSLVRPGISMHEIHRQTVRHLTASMIDLGLLEGDVDELVEKETYKRFYMHSTGHYLGIDVHDVGVSYVDEDEGLALEPGMVLTIEPGLYVPTDDEDAPDAFRGIGIRIEDDVVVTKTGGRVLTDGVPKSIDAIEALRASA